MRYTVVENENFKITVEMGEGKQMIFHVPTLKKWSHSVYKELLLAIAETKDWAASLGKTYIYTGGELSDTKATKFQVMCGFEPWQIVEVNGKTIQMMRQPTHA